MAERRPEGEVRELVDFDKADLMPEFEPPGSLLVVSGDLPCPMHVRIEAEDREYIQEPDYWPNDLVGYHDKVVTPVVTPFEIAPPARDLHRGKKGIELIGKTRREQIDF
jgi:hypothetical protein